MQLAKEGFLERAWREAAGRQRARRLKRRKTASSSRTPCCPSASPCIPSEVVETVEDALAFAKTIGYPVIVRPAYHAGRHRAAASAKTKRSWRRSPTNGLRLSPITQILVEKCISGWKEIEFEVMRDKLGNVIAVCSMENIDPVGVHTGDSIVVAPALTLADKEYQMLRRAALDIITRAGSRGRLQLPVRAQSRHASTMPSSRSTRASAVPPPWRRRRRAIPIAKCRRARSPSATRWMKCRTP